MNFSKASAISLLQAVLFLFIQAAVHPLSGQDYSVLVKGVHEVISPGYPGALLGTNSDWMTVVSGDDDASVPSTFVLARKLSNGRLLAIGYDGIFTNLTLLDNRKFVNNIIS